jgi:hypothetical protein
MKKAPKLLINDEFKEIRSINWVRGKLMYVVVDDVIGVELYWVSDYPDLADMIVFE